MLRATLGTTPYRWRLTHGRLPAGLRLSRRGVLSGVPRHRGHWRVTIGVTDAGHPRMSGTPPLLVDRPLPDDRTPPHLPGPADAAPAEVAAAGTLPARCPRHRSLGRATNCAERCRYSPRIPSTTSPSRKTGSPRRMRVGRPALDRDALERGVVLGGVAELGGDHLFELEVHHRQVGVGADGDRRPCAGTGCTAWAGAAEATSTIRESGMPALVEALGDQHRVQQRGAAEAGQRGPQVIALGPPPCSTRDRTPPWSPGRGAARPTGPRCRSDRGWAG